MDTAATNHKPAASPEDVLSDLIARARRAGATDADAMLSDGTSLSATQRLGEREDVQRSEGVEVGLRVFVGKRQAMVATTETGPRAFDSLVERALAMARAAREDEYCGLAEKELLAKEVPALDLMDAAEPDAETLFARAAETEDAARAVQGVTNSDGAEAGWGRGMHTLVTSDGFAGSYATSRFSLVASVVAGTGTAMETDYAYSRARHGADLRAPADVGREAGERSVRRLNPRKIESAAVPVVFEPRVANSILRHLSQAVSGTAIARGTSFLRKDLGKEIFAPGVTVRDDPHRPRGLVSRPFDGEGVATRPMAIVENGVLQTWILSSASARQLGLRTTGHAVRGMSSAPGPSASNLYMEAGTRTPAELIADIGQGLWITSLIGFGVNMVTGDYSRGASGFWIENGELAYPVAELTIAGSLKEMFRNLTPANDLEFRFGTDAPTLRIDGMTVAGK